MSNTIDVVQRACAPTSDSRPYVYVSRFVDVKLTYRYTGKKLNELSVIRTSKEAEVYFRTAFDPETIALQESFYFMALNRAGRILALVLTSIGSSTGTCCDIKILFAHLVALNAQCVLLCHNHPSGSLHASMSDLDFTKRFKAACAIMDVELRDHIILSPDVGQYYSFADEGLL